MKKYILYWLLLFSILLFINGCQKSVDKPVRTSESIIPIDNSYGKRKVNVSNLDELYSAVNNPANAGAEIVLAPGNYVLSASYPNGGRLELQTDMSLTGQPGNREAVLIDQSSLPFASFRLSPTVSVAPIRMGRGTNSLEWLSVKGGSVAANPLSVIEPDLLGNETNVFISHVYVDCHGSRTGILIRNRLQEHAGRTINATIEDSEIENAISNPGAPGAGLALQNRISGSKINLNMRGNYIHGCRVGILNFNSGLGNNIVNCSLDIISHNDLIQGNGCGLDLSGGSAPAGMVSSNFNTASVKMYGTAIKNNGQPHLPPNNGAFFGGMSAAGGWNTSSNNILTVGFWGCDISDNNGTDIHAHGYFSTTGIVTGTNNLFNLYLYGISANATVESAASVPVEPAGTNIMNVYQ